MLSPVSFYRELWRLFRARRDNPLVACGDVGRGRGWMRWAIRAQALFLLSPGIVAVVWFLTDDFRWHPPMTLLLLGGMWLLPVFLLINFQSLLSPWKRPALLLDLHLTRLTPREMAFGMAYRAGSSAVMLIACWAVSQFVMNILILLEAARATGRSYRFHSALPYSNYFFWISMVAILNLRRFFLMDARNVLGGYLWYFWYLVVGGVWTAMVYFPLYGVFDLIGDVRAFEGFYGSPAYMIAFFTVSILIVLLLASAASVGTCHGLLCRTPGVERPPRGFLEARRRLGLRGTPGDAPTQKGGVLLPTGIALGVIALGVVALRTEPNFTTEPIFGMLLLLMVAHVSWVARLLVGRREAAGVPLGSLSPGRWAWIHPLATLLVLAGVLGWMVFEAQSDTLGLGADFWIMIGVISIVVLIATTCSAIFVLCAERTLSGWARFAWGGFVLLVFAASVGVQISGWNDGESFMIRTHESIFFALFLLVGANAMAMTLALPIAVRALFLKRLYDGRDVPYVGDTRV